MSFEYEKSLYPQSKLLLDQYKAQVVEEHLILKNSQIDWNSKKNQTRFQMADPGHLSSLASDIESRGLQSLPTVELDPSTGKYLILSGHHRMLAMRRLQSDKKTTDWNFPCTVVSFDDPVERLKYLQRSNDHVPTKSHGKKDAVFFIQNMRQENYFSDCTSEDKFRAATYKLLDSYYKRIKGTAKREVFHQAFSDLNLARVRPIQREDAAVFVKDLWNAENMFTWKNNVYYCDSEYNNSKKVVIGSLRKRVGDIKEGLADRDKRGKIRLLTYFPSKYDVESLKKQREDALEEETMMNRIAWNGTCIIIDQICFAPQVDGPNEISESDVVVYNWNYEDQEFVLAE